METNGRVLAAVRLLCESEDLHMKAGEIADALGVSAKTISRELPRMESLLGEYGLRLEKKAGSGLWLEGGSKGLAALREFLSRHTDTPAYTPEERRSIIMGRLLPSEEPVKLFSLASLLKVTDGTISNDLDKLEPWFRQHALKLVRKPGLGVYVEGAEQDLRRAIIRYIYENMGEGELLSLAYENLRGEEGKKTSGAAGHLLKLVKEEVIRKLEGIVRDSETRLGYHLSDNAFIGLVVHLSLAVERMKKQDRIRMEEGFLADLRKKKEFRTASVLAEEIAAAFEIEVPEDEIGYIAMHLLGARSRYREKSMGTISVMDNFHLVRMAKGIMKRASLEAGRDVERNHSLLAGLVNHLGPSVSRIKMNMDIRNPLLSEMKEHYPELMELSRKAVADMEKELGTRLPDSEVAYIAMHLGAALADTEEFRQAQHAVVVACPTGMGTSMLLASRIRQHYGNIRIVDQVSTLSLGKEYAHRQDVEFIISTVPVPNASLPVVVVSPVLGAEDIRRIDLELRHQNEIFLKEASDISPQKKDFREALGAMAEYDRAILAILDRFFFREGEAKSIAEACRMAGELASGDPLAQNEISQALLERENKASTILTGNHMVLLHCRSSFIRDIRMGILHLGSGFRYPEPSGEEVRTAIVLLAPQEATAGAMETIGHISSVLLDRWGLIEVLHEGDRERIEEELVKIFREFYQEKYREWMQR